MIDYDEMLLMLRLEPLDRSAKTAFAAACAQRLVPLSNRYSQQVGDPLREQRLAVIVSAAWQAASGRDIDATRWRAEAEAMVPDEDDEEWTPGRTYAGNAAAAAAYAVRTWLTNDPQEAAWATRQLFDAADLAYFQANPGGDFSDEAEEKASLESPVVQSVIFAIHRDLEAIETGRPSPATGMSRSCWQRRSFTRDAITPQARASRREHGLHMACPIRELDGGGDTIIRQVEDQASSIFGRHSRL